MYCNRFDSVADLLGDVCLWVVAPSICCVKSIRKLVVSSCLPTAGVFCFLGVGDGEREVDDRLREVRGVASEVPRGVRVMSPRLVGLWPSLAKTVISGISEKVLKHVSSMSALSSAGIIELRMSRPAWKAATFCAGVRSNEFPRLSDFGVAAPLRLDFSGVFLGEVEALRVDGGGIRSESLLPLRCSLTVWACSGVDGFLGEENTFDSVAVASSCGTFSLSSSMCCKSSNGALLGVVSTSCAASSSFMLSAIGGLHRVLALRLCVSTSVTKGELGGPSKSMMLCSASWPEGESMLSCVSLYALSSMLCASIYDESLFTQYKH